MPKLESPRSSAWSDDMYRFYAKRRRQPRWMRILFIAALIGVIYFIGVHSINSSSWTGGISDLKSASQASGKLGHNVHHRPKTAAQEPLTGDEEEEEENDKFIPAPETIAKTKSKTAAGADAVAEDDVDADVETKPKTTKAKAKAKAATYDYDEDEEEDTEVAKEVPEGEEGFVADGPIDTKLDQGLKHIFDIAPDELHVRELLRPITDSGKERLRELGLRARAFRHLLEAWEDVHLIFKKDAVLVRDDLITYLSKVKSLTGIHSHKSRAEIIRSYEGLRYFLTKLSDLLFPWTAPYFADHMTLHASIKHGGRGIVLSGGDGQLSYLLTSARNIRRLGCNLPIEVMYLGDDDLGDDSRSELEALPGVITRDMKQMVHDEGWDLKGWAGKPFAILLSSFREAIFIDADAMFLANPEILFEDPGYEETGSLFFKDRLMFPESKRKWLQQILPKPMSRKVRASRFWTGESGHYQESGVVVVDKWRHFMALLFITRMNGPDRDGDKDKGIVGTYDMVYGDKETFWLGWELVGDHDYYFHPGEAGNMGFASTNYDEARRHVMGISELEEDKKKKAEEDKNKEEDAKKKIEEEETKKNEEEEKKKRDEEETKKNEEEEKKRKEEGDLAAAEKKDQDPLGLGDSPPKTKRALDYTDEETEEDVVRKVIDTMSSEDGNFTICAPQLLHLDRDNRPLWFNGWILDNKFDVDHPRLSTFDSFMLEHKDTRAYPDWRLEENNLCCLISDRVYKFTKEEKEALEGIADIAKDVGALKARIE